MKDKRKALFLNALKNKKKRIGVILSIVAVVEAFLIMVVSTSAWVESISSIKIHTTAQSEANGTKGTIESFLYQKAKLSIDANTDIDLTKYFRPSGNYHLAGASSADGNTIYFPEKKGGDTHNFRLGTINDKNVNYISFTIKTETKVDLAFDQLPTISFNNTPLSTDAQKKLVRFSIGDPTGAYKVYSLADEFEEDVTVGYTQSGATYTPVTKHVKVYSFNDYLKGKNKVVTTKAGGYLTFNLWIQDPTGASSSVYHNKALTISNLKLVTVIPITVKSTYLNAAGTAYTAGPNGGNVKVGTASYTTPFSEEAVYYAAINTTLTLTANASEVNGYSFVGWSHYLDVNGSHFNELGTSNPVTYTITASNKSKTVYAKFSDTKVLFLNPVYSYSDSSGNNMTNMKYGAYVYGNDSEGNFTKTWYSLQSTSGSPYATSHNGEYYFAYRGTADRIIFCYMKNSWSMSSASLDVTNLSNDTNWNSRLLQSFNLRVPTGVGEHVYYARSRYIAQNEGEPLGNDSHSGFNYKVKTYGFWKDLCVTVDAAYYNGCDNTMGSVYAKLKHSTTNHTTVTWYCEDQDTVCIDPFVDTTESTPYNQKVIHLKATPTQEYNFTAWYLHNTTENNYSQVSTNAECDVTVPDTYLNGTTCEYCAKFTEKEESWKLMGDFDNWTTGVTMSGSGTSFSCTKALTNGQKIEFKIFDAKRNQWWTDQQNYTDIITSTVINNVTLSGAAGLGNMSITAGYAGTYTFTLSTANNQKKLTVTSTPVVPTVKLWNNSIDGGTGNSITMTQLDPNTNVLTCTKTLTAEGGKVYFKVHDETRDLWYSNKDNSGSGSYIEYTDTTLLNNGQLSTSNSGNMYIHGHAGTYTFRFDYSTKKLSITADYTDITITLNSSKVSSWIGDGSCKIYFVANGQWTLMSGSGSAYTVSVPSNYANNTQFLRRDSSNNTTYNYWPDSETYRGFKKTFTISFSDGNNHSGSWS